MTPTEAEIQARIVDVAHLYGWRVAHFRPARTAQGWRTPVAYDGAGFPDLVLIRGDRILYREIKSDRGQLSAAQREWIASLRLAGADVDVWRPRSWPWIVEDLSEGRAK